MVFQVQIYFFKRQTTLQFIKSDFGAEWLALVRILEHSDLNVVSGNGYTNVFLSFFSHSK